MTTIGTQDVASKAINKTLRTMELTKLSVAFRFILTVMLVTYNQ